MTALSLHAKGLFFVVLALAGAAFTVLWFRVLWQTKPRPRPTAYELVVGVITDFFDTLGIGSYATTTALYRLRRTVPDRLLPGTLNVGHTIPSLAQAFIYVAIVDVDPTTLISMIASAALGANLGARVVTRLPRRAIQIGLGVGLLVASVLLLAKQLDRFPRGGDTRGLEGGALVLACVANFVLGALMTLGIGLYAPCMIVISLLGMNAKAAFPIMMGSCALLMIAASGRFVKAEAYSPKAALGLTIGGLPAVLFAAWVVRSLPLASVRWLVLLVVLYTSVSMLRAAAKRDAP